MPDAITRQATTRFSAVRRDFNNTSGNLNSFFGFEAGKANTFGINNAFFGAYTGTKSTGGFNAFFGTGAGLNSTTGSSNALFGDSSGLYLTTGSSNTFLGAAAGFDVLNNAGVTAGDNNTLVGSLSGKGITTGSNNTFLGSNTTGVNNLINASAIGANTVVSQSNSLILGNNANVGIGTSAPNSKLTVVGLIETTTGGVKFPDGTIQTTASTGVSGSFINNQTTPQAGANFNIAGNGTVGGTLTANTAQVTGSGFVLGNFGIGTNAPRAKLDVTGGNILVDSPGNGIILKSPDANTCRLLTINDAGAIALTPVTCP